MYTKSNNFINISLFFDLSEGWRGGGSEETHTILKKNPDGIKKGIKEYKESLQKMHGDIKLQTQQLSQNHESNSGLSDGEKIISRYAIRLQGIQQTLHQIREHRDENTGFFNVLADDVVHLAGGESGKAIYERTYQNIKNSAKEAIKQLDTETNGKNLTKSEWLKYSSIRSELEKCLGEKLGEPNPLLTIANTLSSAGETIKHATNKGSDYGMKMLWEQIDKIPNPEIKKLLRSYVAESGGTFKGLGDTFGGLFDLTAFVAKYLGSSGYRQEINNIATELNNRRRTDGWDMVWGVCYKIGLEYDKATAPDVPMEKQAEMIGRIKGNILGMIATGGILGAASKAKSAATATSEALQVASKAAQVAGKSEQAAALALSASEQASKAMVYKIGAFILNGPAESAIGAGLSKSFQLASGAIRGGVSLKNLKTVEKSIEDFGNAIKNNGADPEKLKYLQEAKEALESEKKKITDTIAKQEVQKQAVKNEKQSRLSENPKSLAELQTELTKKKAELAKSEDMARTPFGGASDGLLANEARLKKEIGELEAKIGTTLPNEGKIQPKSTNTNPRGIEVNKTPEFIKYGPTFEFQNIQEIAVEFKKIGIEYNGAFSDGMLLRLPSGKEIQLGFKDVRGISVDPSSGVAFLKSPDGKIQKLDGVILETKPNIQSGNIARASTGESSIGGIKEMLDSLNEVKILLKDVGGDFLGKIDNLSSLLKGNIISNFDMIQSLLKGIGEDLSGALKLSYTTKKKLESIMNGLKQKFGSGDDIARNVFPSKTTDINIPRSNGKILGLERGSYQALRNPEGGMTVWFMDNGRNIQKNISVEDFRKVNPQLFPDAKPPKNIVRESGNMSKMSDELRILTDPTLSIKERSDIIKSLPRTTKQEKDIVKQEIARLRDIMDNSRKEALGVVSKIMDALEMCEKKGESFDHFTKYVGNIMDIQSKIPKDMWDIFAERFSIFMKDVKQQEQFHGKSTNDLLADFFNFDKNGTFNVTVQQSPVSQNFIFHNHDDFQKAYSLNDPVLGTGFTRDLRNERGSRIIAVDATDGSGYDTLGHEVRHTFNGSMNYHEKGNMSLSESEAGLLKGLNESNIDNTLSDLLRKKFGGILDANAKDEIIAWIAGDIKNRQPNEIKNAMIRNYDYIKTLRDNIPDIVPSSLSNNAYSNILQQSDRYNSILNKMVDVACQYGTTRDKLNELMITPFREWYKFDTRFTRVDFSI